MDMSDTLDRWARVICGILRDVGDVGDDVGEHHAFSGISEATRIMT